MKSDREVKGIFLTQKKTANLRSLNFIFYLISLFPKTLLPAMIAASFH
jgi:hypothetical protein